MPRDKLYKFPMETGPNGDLIDSSVVRVGRAFRVNWAFVNDNPASYLYEVYDRHHRLVYVGITDNFAARWSAHLRSSWWATSIEIDCVILRGYTSRSDARMVEAMLIADEKPPCNVKPEHKYLRLVNHLGEPDDILTAELVPTRKF